MKQFGGDVTKVGTDIEGKLQQGLNKAGIRQDTLTAKGTEI